MAVWGPKEVRNWLLKQPRPTVIRLVSEDQQPHAIDLPPGASYMKAAETIAALQPELLEAVGPDGKLIRAVRPAEEAEPQEDRALNEFANADPVTSQTIIFARLIAEAYRHSTETAFDRMVSLFEAVNRRSEALEKSLELTQRILTKAAADQLAQAEGGAAGGSSLIEQMVTSFLSGQKQGAANGAIKPPSSEGTP